MHPLGRRRRECAHSGEGNVEEVDEVRSGGGGGSRKEEEVGGDLARQ